MGGPLIVALILLLRFGSIWLDPEVRVDEGIYLQAFDAVAAGVSPFTIDGYLYPPAFAHFGSWSNTLLGAAGTRALLRISSLLSLLLIAAHGVRWWRRFGSSPPDSWRPWWIAAGLLVVSTGVELGLATANASFIAIALLLEALKVLESRPVVAGLFLAMSALIKPFALPAVAVLAVAGWVAEHRPWLWASVTAGVVGLSLNLPSPYLFEMLSASPSALTDIRAGSIDRILKLLGFEVSPLAVLVATTGVACSLAWVLGRRFLDGVRRGESRHPLDIHLLCLLGILAMPVLWSHSLVIFLPVICGTLALSWARRATAREHLPWVWLGAAAIIFSESGAVDLLWAPVQVLLLLPSLVAPIGLSLYLSRSAPEALTLIETDLSVHEKTGSGMGSSRRTENLRTPD